MLYTVPWSRSPSATVCHPLLPSTRPFPFPSHLHPKFLLLFSRFRNESRCAGCECGSSCFIMVCSSPHLSANEWLGLASWLNNNPFSLSSHSLMGIEADCIFSLLWLVYSSFAICKFDSFSYIPKAIKLGSMVVVFLLGGSDSFFPLWLSSFHPRQQCRDLLVLLLLVKTSLEDEGQFSASTLIAC